MIINHFSNNETRIENVISFLELLIAVLFLVTGNSVYAVQNVYSIPFDVIIVSLSSLLGAISLFQLLNDTQLIKRMQIIYIFITIYHIVFIIMSVSRDNLKEYLFGPVIFVFSFTTYFIYAYKHGRIGKIFLKYTNITVIISIISLGLWFFSTIKPIIEPCGLISTVWGGIPSVKNYYYVYFETQSESLFGSIIIRNTGMFIEGPMYALHLILSISFLWLFCEKKCIFKYFILILTLISTITTVGILSLVLFSFLMIVYYRKKIFKNGVVPFIFFILLLFGSLALINKSSSGSFSTRVDDYVAGFVAWSNSPVWGNGFNYFKPIIMNMHPSRISNTGYSNSIMLILAQGGLYLSAFYFIPLIYFGSILYSIFNKKIIYVSIMIVFLMTSIIFSYSFIIYAYIALLFALFVLKDVLISNHHN